MSQYTTPNLTVQAADGVTYTYRRYGKDGTVPVVFFQHFRGNLDNWDPAFVDRLVTDRESSACGPRRRRQAEETVLHCRVDRRRFSPSRRAGRRGRRGARRRPASPRSMRG